MTQKAKKPNKRWRFFSNHPVLLIDEAFHLLRTIPLSFFMVYYVGVLPFAAGLVYFVSMMLHDAYAHRYVIPATAGVCVLFIWMKAWQARFSSLLWAWLGGDEPPEMTVRFFFQLCMQQVAIQPIGLITVPLSLFSVIFFPPFYMFFHRASLLSGRKQGNSLEVLKGITNHPGNAFLNYYLVVWTSKLLWIFIFIATIMVLEGGPHLLKSVLGIHTPISRGEFSFFSGHFGWTVLFTAVYCIFDPIIRAIVALDVFYAESATTGVDLLAEFRGFVRNKAGLVIMLLSAGLIASASYGAEIDPDHFEKQVQNTLKESDYSWRMPREDELFAYDEAGMIEKLYRFTEENISYAWEWFTDLVSDTWDWVKMTLKRWFKPRPQSNSGSDFNIPWLSPLFSWMGPWMGVVLRTLFVIIAFALLIFGGFKLFKYLQGYKGSKVVIAEPVSMPMVNIEDEEVTADQLPEDDWMHLAEDLITKGDLRLAMRAMYLALLVFLGDRRLILIAKFKSNYDYVGELNRRHHELPEVLEKFKDNVSLFEFAWYGMHDVRDEALERFRSNAERIRNDVQS